MKFCARMVCVIAVFMAGLGLLSATAGQVQAAVNLVEKGQPRAQIVIAPDAPRMARLAALELQHYLQKMTGAKLPIVTEVGDELPLKIYVGKSQATQTLGIETANLKYGASRMVSGDDYLVLIGQDDDYVPPVPFSVRPKDAAAIEKWDELTQDKTDSKWGFPFNAIYKHYWNPRDLNSTMAARYGADNEKIWNPAGAKWARVPSDEQPGYWNHDRSGSLNAVCEFLRMYGVRWYMPSDLGEVVPQSATLLLPRVDRTTVPDYKMRGYFWYNYSGFSYDDVMWARRNGINSIEETLGAIGPAHGMTHIHERQEMQGKHPEYYGMFNGERDTTFRGSGRACFSSQGLVNESINYASFLFDQYNAPHVSLFPQDGYNQCECDLCKGKSPSELVWGYVEKVASELYKKYPDRLVSCGAYTSYVYAPESIRKFSPNVVVVFTNRGRSSFMNDEAWETYVRSLKEWTDRLAPGRLIRIDNNRFSLNAQIREHVIAFPTIHPHAMARDLKFLKGISLGENSEQAQRLRQWTSMHFDHVTLYVQSQLFWDSQRDVDALLNEYYETFYGPAAKAMKTAFEFAEANFNKPSKYNSAAVDQNVRIKFLQLMLDARAKAGDSIYGQRIDFILSGYENMETLQKELADMIAKGTPRDSAPTVLATRVKTIADIKAIEAAAPSYDMKVLKTGEPADVKTTFKLFWVGDDTLVVKARCEEPDMANLFNAAQVWGGDAVSVLIEPPGHSYYQIEVNAAGAVFDADRQGKMDIKWQSLVKVEPVVGKNFWEVTMVFPIVSRAQAESDPNHNISGDLPTDQDPWYINVCRSRVRGDVTQAYAFSKVEKGNFHDKDRFVKLKLKD